MLVLVPSFQPDRRLVELVGDLQAHPDTSDILIVNDGSGPDYSALFAAAAAADATVIGYPDNRGKGHALRAGFAWAIANRPGEPVVCADSDGQHAAADIRAVARATALPGAGLVLGTRNFGSPPRPAGRRGDPVAQPPGQQGDGPALRVGDRPPPGRHPNGPSGLPRTHARLAVHRPRRTLRL